MGQTTEGGTGMENRRTMAPSVYARAAMMRRAASRKRTINVNRSPNAPLGASFEVARDALEVAWDATQELRAEHERKPMRQMTHKTRPPKTQGRDTFGPVYVAGAHTVYGVHYRTRLVGAERKVYVRNDAWAKARSAEVGAERLAAIVEPRTRLAVRAGNVSGIGNGTYPRIWTATGERPRFRDYSPSMFKRDDEADDASLWALRFGVLDGLRYRFLFNRETGEMRRA
jgi:hypothetical protein